MATTLKINKDKLMGVETLYCDCCGNRMIPRQIARNCLYYRCPNNCNNKKEVVKQRKEMGL